MRLRSRMSYRLMYPAKDISFKNVGSFDLKGFDEPMVIYHVIYGGAGRGRVILPTGRAAPFPIWYWTSNALRRERSAVCHRKFVHREHHDWLHRWLGTLEIR